MEIEMEILPDCLSLWQESEKTMNETDTLQSAPVVGISRHRLTTDGEGVTTLVVFHGCPLRCKYCLNPHTLSPETIQPVYDTQLLYDEVKIDELYFLATKGGITFGGGEPCLRSKFIEEFRQLCGEAWTLNVETSLNVPRSHLERLLPVINEYIVDIKDMNPDIYQTYTGKDNKQSLANLQWLVEQGKAEHIMVRIPHIPHFNTQEDITLSVERLKEMGLSRFDLFTYRTY